MEDQNIPFASEDGFTPESAASEDVIESLPDLTKCFTLWPHRSTSKETREMCESAVERENVVKPT
jgi:hypothetical protein